MKLSNPRKNMYVKTTLTAALAVIIGGCVATNHPYMRNETAQRIAAPAWMIKRDISASPYILRSYERIHDRGGVANLYIEGDGSELTSSSNWTDNPTPENPVALHLASKDKAENVIYLARPCQYTAMISKSDECDKSSWKENRFSTEVIKSYQLAMDNISSRYGISGFNLIGYSGGGAIATLLAASRADVMSLRTVAGVLDHEVQSNLLAKPKLSGSLNPVTKAASLSEMPQYHFIGGQDEFVPPAILHSYLQAMPEARCVQTMLVQEASYDTGWVDKWPELLELPVTCYNSSPIEQVIEESSTPMLAPIPSGMILNTKPAKP